MSTCALLSMLVIAAATAFLLGLAVSLPHMVRQPRRNDVWVRDE